MQHLVSNTFCSSLSLNDSQCEFYTWAVRGYGNTRCGGKCGPTYGGKKATLSTPIYVRPWGYDPATFQRLARRMLWVRVC